MKLRSKHYYPFGLRLGGLSTTTGVPNRYRYNGKELHDELGLGWYDYGFRWYDPAVARFVSVDPLAESFPELTTYQYAGNTPIWAVDLDGLEPAVTTSNSIPVYYPAGDQEGRRLHNNNPGAISSAAEKHSESRSQESMAANEVSSQDHGTISAPPSGQGGSFMNGGGDHGFGAGEAAREAIVEVGGGMLFSKIIKPLKASKMAKALKTNKAIGKAGEELATKQLKVEFPGATVLNQVSGKFDDASRTVLDNVVFDPKDGKIKLANETKTGGAKLSGQQKRFHEKGQTIELVGKNAEDVKGKTINSSDTQTRVTRIKREDINP